MISVLIYLLFLASAFILAHLFCSVSIPFFLKSYKQWQGKRFGRVANKLEDSFIFLEKQRVIFLSVFPLVFAVIGFILLKNLLGLILGILLGFAFPGIMIKVIHQGRIKKFRSQLVDSLMILSSSLKGGLSFVQAIEVLCEEMPAPISQEFNLILKENRWGVSLGESLKKLRERMPLEEVNLIVSSVLVARETGGELTKVFSRLTETIRNNLKLKEKVATLTLQGKLQGVIMSFLPVGFAAFIHKQNPEHFKVMWETELGRKLLIVAFFAMLIGMFLIKKISTIKI